ncbi:MAG TPA: PspC domain-containing protein [Fulvivirga sp.]|nr:PspC domain-containing protein [Fulvivirga sp.]
MKKNISINISGIIFHIEEDAFDQLKGYLDGINSYFSTFDDSHEIIADIESRIAEIFLAKLNDEKQVITVADVESLMTTMGSIRDFQAIEEPELEEEETKSGQGKSKKRTYSNKSSKKLYRDEKHKLVGGVCAGVAHHLNFDPLWIRLLFLVLLFGSFGTILVVYLVMWAVIPGNPDLSEDNKLKKMFRDGEQKVLGGVASGIANYFGVDVVIVRVIFVLSIFVGGAGIMAYIILWIVLPEAKTFSDKVQMKGDPVTLSNIENNIKQSLNVSENEDESVFVKILLFPFRLIALIFGTLGKALGPFLRLFVDFIRIIAGVFFILVAFFAILSLIIAIGVVIGIFSSDIMTLGHLNFGQMGIPLETMTNGLPGFTAAAAFFVIITPFILMLLLGASIIARRIIFTSNTGWTLFAVFIISIVVLAINVPSIIFNFSDHGEYSTTQRFDIGNKTAVLKLKDTGLDEYQVTSLRLEGYNGDVLKLDQVFEAQGRSRIDAAENARMVDYNIEQDDSVLYFDSNISFKRDAIFRAQRLDMTLYIPYNKTFMMDEDMRHIIRNTIYRNGYRVSDMENNKWRFTNSGLECLTCETYRNDRGTRRSSDKRLIMEPFDIIDIKGVFTVNIEHADDYEVLLDVPRDLIDNIDVNQDFDKLEINFTKLGHRDASRYAKKEIQITIRTPKVSKIEFTGASTGYMSGFDLNEINMELSGASSFKADIQARTVNVDLSGASYIELRGEGEELNADVSGASNLDADRYEVKFATLESSGLSSIKAYVTKRVMMDESMVSNIKVRGDAEVNTRKQKF